MKNILLIVIGLLVIGAGVVFALTNKQEVKGNANIAKNRQLLETNDAKLEKDRQLYEELETIEAKLEKLEKEKNDAKLEGLKKIDEEIEELKKKM